MDFHGSSNDCKYETSVGERLSTTIEDAMAGPNEGCMVLGIPGLPSCVGVPAHLVGHSFVALQRAVDRGTKLSSLFLFGRAVAVDGRPTRRN